MKQIDISYIRKGFFVSKSLLALLLGYMIVETLILPQQQGEIFGPTSVVSSENVGPVEARNSAIPLLRDYSAIIERSIFGDVCSLLRANESFRGHNGSSLVRSAEEELGLALLGTVSGSPVVSRAIIKDIERDLSGLYKTGDIVADASIESIETETVVLLHDGERKMLRLNADKNHNENNAQPPPPQTANELSKVVESVTGEPIKQTPIEIPTKIKHVETILRKAVIEPYTANGQMEGLKIGGLENIKLAKDLGLKNGDIIRTVNGHRLTSKQKAYQVLKKARSQPTINLELLRGDETKRLSFVLR